MNKFTILQLTVLTALLAGCATRPISNTEAETVTGDSILNSQYLNKAPNTGTVTVKRDSGGNGSMCSSRVFVNGVAIADLDTSEKVVLYLPEDDYIFSAWPNGICGGGMSEVRSTVKSGAELNYRIGYGSNGDYTINATAF